MQKALRMRTTVQPGGKVEIVSPELEAGQTVDVVISPVPVPSARSAWQIISEGPGHRLFKTAKELDDYIAEERASWNRRRWISPCTRDGKPQQPEHGRR